MGGACREAGHQLRGEERAAPDHVIFQSWHDHPDRVLPETDTNTFTYLINRYFRLRTRMLLSLDSSGIRGTLTDAAGAPVANARVELALAPSAQSPGVFGEYVVSGVVPSEATQAVVGFRINEECDCRGGSDFVLYQIRCLDGEGRQVVLNADFSKGLDGWGLWGTGDGRLEPGERSASALHVKVQPAQSLGLNSVPLAVTPNTAYTVTFAARVSPASVGSGYFMVIFLASTEIFRSIISLKPGSLPAGVTRTDAEGKFAFDLPTLPAGSVMQVQYPGDEQYSPACALLAEGACDSNYENKNLGPVTKAHPTPHLTLRSPSRVMTGAPALSLAVHGSNFIPDSVVRWNGSNRPTEFLNNTLLRATIAASDVLSAGLPLVSVFNPTPGESVSNALPLTVAALPAPAITAGGIVDSAGFRQGLSGGSIAALFGTNLSSGTMSAGTLPLPTTLGRAAVRVNGVAAPLFFASPTQINFQIPWESLREGRAYVSVMSDGVTSSAELVNLAGMAPGLFALDSSGSGQGAIAIAATGELAGPAGNVAGLKSRPVRPGDFISIYCTGLGAVASEPGTGAAASGALLSPTNATPVVTIGGIPATVTFSGLAPSFVGLYQVNAQVPDAAPAGGAVPVVVTMENVKSNAVTIAIQ